MMILATIRDVWGFSHNIIRVGRQLVNNGLRPLGLSSAEGNVLLHLLSEGDAVRQEDLVERLDVSKTAISRAVDTLEEKGYATREKDLSDKRASLIYLTPKASEIAGPLEEVYNSVFAVAAEGVDVADIAAFSHLFERVSANFDRARAAGRSRT
jgi:DNA-binding MarR family transcriptional regulator